MERTPVRHGRTDASNQGPGCKVFNAMGAAEEDQIPQLKSVSDETGRVITPLHPHCTLNFVGTLPTPLSRWEFAAIFLFLLLLFFHLITSRVIYFLVWLFQVFIFSLHFFATCVYLQCLFY